MPDNPDFIEPFPGEVIKQWRAGRLSNPLTWPGNVDRAAPADRYQPRLMAVLTCLTVTFENGCDLLAKCLWLTCL